MSQTDNNLNIFICSHIPFRPLIQTEQRPDIYKIITNCNDDFPKTNLEILRVDEMKCDYPSEENILLNEYRMINAIYCMGNKPDYIGICHYRRYYGFEEIERLDCKTLFDNFFQILLGRPVYFEEVLDGKYNNETYFGYWHSYSAWQEIEKIFKDFHPDLTNEFDEMKKANFLHNSAMMIMPKELFNEWCEFIFPLYEELKEKLNMYNQEDALRYVEKYENEFIKPFNPLYDKNYQSRFIGYVLERYVGVWLRTKHKNNKTLLESAGTLKWGMVNNEIIKI
jgi:hypothetical protein